MNEPESYLLPSVGESSTYFKKPLRRAKRIEAPPTSPATWLIPPSASRPKQVDDAVTADLRDRLAAVERAEARLREGTLRSIGEKRPSDSRRPPRGRSCR